MREELAPGYLSISVIITTYNRPDYLRRVIEGYLRQTCLPAEIVIADDGSGPETARVVENLRRSALVRTKHVWQEDQGFRAASIRNKAIVDSCGDYLILSDDDSIPMPTLVEDHLNCAEPGHFVQGHRVLLGPAVSETFAPENTSFLRFMRLRLRNEAHNVLNAIWLPWPVLSKSRKLRGIRSCNMSFFRRDFLAVNGFNEELVGWGKEDTELVVRFYKFGLKCKDMRFHGTCYHLYHPPYSRENLQRNIAILEQTLKNAAYRCGNGVDKYLCPTRM